jgi:myosin VI
MIYLFFQYLKNGCTQYFVNSQSQTKLSAGQKSQAQQAKGPLKDSMLDDVNDFAEMDKVKNRKKTSNTSIKYFSTLQ